MPLSKLRRKSIALTHAPILLSVPLTILLAVFLAHPFSARAEKKRSVPACIPLADVAQQSAQPGSPPKNDICVQAHIYGVVELQDGTRFLDVCPPETADEDCHFLLVSLRDDRQDVGDLRRFHNQDVQIRGTIRMYRGRFGMRISHARQFEGGPEKFRPNPKLLHDFNGQSDRMPVRDPALRSSGRHRSFMDRTDREELPADKKP